MSTTKHPIESEELMAYLDGELPTQQATAALAHLEQCLGVRNPGRRSSLRISQADAVGSCKPRPPR